MSDLISGSSTWASGTGDTASTLQNGVDEKRAEHHNGPNAFIIALQGKLGTAASLVGSKPDLATRLAVGIDSGGILTSAEPGDMCMSARTSKTGWLICNNTLTGNRSTHSALFAAIGTTFGTGDGITTFGLPNLAARVPVGTGAGVGNGSTGIGQPAGSALPTIPLAGWDGDRDTTLPTHSHTISDSGHAHTQRRDLAAGGASSFPSGSNSISTTQNAGATSSDVTGISINNAGSSPTDQNYPPYLGMNFFIKT